MKALVVYDSNYGNTKIIALAIAAGLGMSSKAVKVDEIKDELRQKYSLLVVGSPIIGWKPSGKMGEFLKSLPKDSLKGIKAVSFDTRINIIFHGDAAKKISSLLSKAGAVIISKPQAFFVKGEKGPLLENETKKAIEWAKELKIACGGI